MSPPQIASVNANNGGNLPWAVLNAFVGRPKVRVHGGDYRGYFELKHSCIPVPRSYWERTNKKRAVFKPPLCDNTSLSKPLRKFGYKINESALVDNAMTNLSRNEHRTRR
jgi:hypothetical protein